MTFNPNREELAWAAGFFDGEGHVRSCMTNTRGGRVQPYRDWFLSISQVHPAVLERFRAAVGGIGTIGGPYKRKNPNAQDVYRFAAGGFHHVQAIGAMLLPFLSPVKVEQFEASLSWRPRTAQAEREYRAQRTVAAWARWREGGSCRRGHPYSEENTYIYLDRPRNRTLYQCKVCANDARRKRRAKARAA